MEENDISQLDTSDSQQNHLRGVIEAILFVNERPVTVEQIKRVVNVELSQIKRAIAELQDEHSKRDSGMNIVEIAGGFQLLSNRKYAAHLREFYKTRHKEKLSKPALETMAIVAYKQPVARGDIELIRGVNSDGVVAHLMNKELIKVVGRKDVPGKPYLYGTTKLFLEYFGLKSLNSLPKLEEFPSLLPDSEKSNDNNEYLGEKIPEHAVAANSLEALKQSAISQAPDVKQAQEQNFDSTEENSSEDEHSEAGIALENSEEDAVPALAESEQEVNHESK